MDLYGAPLWGVLTAAILPAVAERFRGAVAIASSLLLLTPLIKASIQIKAVSALGLFLLALQTLVFLATAGPLALLGWSWTSGNVSTSPPR